MLLGGAGGGLFVAAPVAPGSSVTVTVALATGPGSRGRSWSPYVVAFRVPGKVTPPVSAPGCGHPCGCGVASMFFVERERNFGPGSI